MKLVYESVTDPVTGKTFYEVDPNADIQKLVQIDNWLQKRIGFSIDEAISTLYSSAKDWEDTDPEEYEYYHDCINQLAMGTASKQLLRSIAELLQ